jgi:hypothetical protein
MVQVFEDFTNLKYKDKGYKALNTPERDYIREFHLYYSYKLINKRDLLQ